MLAVAIDLITRRAQLEGVGLETRSADSLVREKHALQKSSHLEA
jgi:hypothetical protein